jgi:hypothetical protein
VFYHGRTPLLERSNLPFRAPAHGFTLRRSIMGSQGAAMRAYLFSLPLSWTWQSKNRSCVEQLAHPGFQRRQGVRANRLFEAFDKLVGESDSLVGKVETNARPPALPLQLAKRIVRTLRIDFALEFDAQHARRVLARRQRGQRHHEKVILGPRLVDELHGQIGDRMLLLVFCEDHRVRKNILPLSSANCCILSFGPDCL